MLRVETRARLDARDVDLVILLLARGSEAARMRYERILYEEGLDVLLDAPDLPERLMAVRTLLAPSEPLLFYVLLRHALRASGIDDREVADYLATLLIHFGRRDRAWRIDWHDDARHRYMVDIVADLSQSSEPRRFKVMVHLGDYALWLAGVFPHYVAARRLRAGGPDLDYYDALGQRGYAMACDHALSGELGLAGILRTQAERFPAIRGALNDLAERVFFPVGRGGH